MTDRELKKLSRAELLEMLIAQSRENASLKEQLNQAEEKLKDRQILTDNAGSIAEAALQLNGVFEAAQASAAQYLENIELRSKRADELEKEARARATQLLSEAVAKCRGMIAETRRKCEGMVKDAQLQVAVQLDDTAPSRQPGEVSDSGESPGAFGGVSAAGKASASGDSASGGASASGTSGGRRK